MKCERCQVSTKGYELHDYCKHCSKNLCDGCMKNGCCGRKPADSGMEEDHAESDDEPEEGLPTAGVSEERSCT